MASKSEIIAKLLAKSGRKSAIDAMCVDCNYDPLDKGSWRAQTGGV